MLLIKNLNSWFPDHSISASATKENQILKDVTLTIKEGQTVALVGESGSGKTITALNILRLLEESTGIRVTGSVLFQNSNLLNLTLDEMRSIRGNRISMIFQEPMTSLNPVYTIGSQLLEPLCLHQGLSKEDAREEAVKLLIHTEIDDPETRMNCFPHQLSGGQRQRIMIAMALACRPSLLIADEPTTALDVTVQSQILKLLKNLQKEYGMAILLITHDLTMVRENADFIYIMKQGSIIEQGSVRSIFDAPQDGYTKRLINAIPVSKEDKPTSGVPLLSVTRMNCHFKIASGWISPFKRKYNHIRAVDDVSLVIDRGTTCGVIGESGSGKTTLGLAMLRLIRSHGEIIFKDSDLQSLSSRELRSYRQRLQIVFQDPFSSLSPRMTIADIVGEGLRVHSKDLDSQSRQRRVVSVLEEVGLDESYASRYPHEFSGGQRQRIAIARALILRPELLILDEPTSALDMTIQAQIISLLLSLQEKFNLTYLFISHDLRVIRAVSDQIIVMRKGKIVESGDASSIFSNPSQQYTKDLFGAALDTCSMVDV